MNVESIDLSCHQNWEEEKHQTLRAMSEETVVSGRTLLGNEFPQKWV